MKDIKRWTTSGRKCVLSSDFTTKWEIMFTLDIISMLGSKSLERSPAVRGF